MKTQKLILLLVMALCSSIQEAQSGERSDKAKGVCGSEYGRHQSPEKENWEILYDNAGCYAQLGEYEMSLVNIDKAIAARPEDVALTHFRAQLLAQLDKESEADIAFQRVVEIAYENPEQLKSERNRSMVATSLVHLAMKCMLEEQWDEGKAYIEKARTLSPSDLWVKQMSGYFYAAMHNKAPQSTQ